MRKLRLYFLNTMYIHTHKKNACSHMHTHTHTQTSTDACYLARHVALKAGVPMTTPALTVNRLCGSGFQSIINGAQVCSPNSNNVEQRNMTKERQQTYLAIVLYCISQSEHVFALCRYCYCDVIV